MSHYTTLRKGANMSYRQSRYTLAEKAGEGEHLLYNTANGTFAMLDDAAFACYESFSGAGAATSGASGAGAATSGASGAGAGAAAGGAGGAGAGGAGDPNGAAAGGAVADALARWGFITQLSPQEELAALRAKIEAHRADHGAFTLAFVPTYACNFRCPYCYEQDRIALGGRMGEEVMDAVMRFVEARHERYGFTTLSVQWYGGDPSLALEQVGELSARLIDWCDAQGIAYDAIMLSNANVIGPAEADLMAACRIRLVFLTIDGPEGVHNQRRVAGNGTNSYERTLQAARLLRERGVELIASMNVDRITWPLFAETRDKLLAEEGIVVNAGRLCDYGHTYGTPPFAPPTFDLFTHEEFCRERVRLFESEPHTASELRALLAPIDQFCTGQSGDYYVIDFRGDVFSCDGWIGYPENVRFNVCDGPDTWLPSEIVLDAPADAKCSACEILPLCLGSCIWERELTGMPCHPLKGFMGNYLRVYRSCFPDASPSATAPGFTLLAS